jgi:peptidyl-prolyl cis-trans isomerase B (cyclophilin B)
VWHRVEPNVLIETGDPTGRIDDTSDGPGYAIPDELPSKGSEYVYGTVAMANAGPNTGGSRFFIVVHDPEQDRPAGFPPAYSIFGRVDESTFATIENIAKVPTRGGKDPAVAFQPVNPVYVKTIEVIER